MGNFLRIALVVFSIFFVSGCHSEVIVRTPLATPVTSFKTINVQIDAKSLQEEDLDPEDREYFRTRLNHRVARVGSGLQLVEPTAASDLTLRVVLTDYGRTNRGRDVEFELAVDVIDNARKGSIGKFDVKINSKRVDDEDDPIDKKLDKGPTQKAIDHAAIKIVAYLQKPEG